MNICFFSGEIVSEVIFKFIINKDKSFRKCKHFSICYFDLKLKNSTVIKLKAYDRFADFCCRSLKEGDKVAVYGRLNDSFECDIFFLKILKLSTNLR